MLVLLADYWFTNLIIYLSASATKACYGFHKLGISTYREKYCWDRSRPVIGNFEELRGAIYALSLVSTLVTLKVTWVMLSLQASGFQNQFYKTYFLNIEQEIFAVLTDTFHKPGFKLHVFVLQHLFYVVNIYTYMFICCSILWWLCVLVFDYYVCCHIRLMV